MKIGITGATGFIGRRIIQLANERGHTVLAFSRDPRKPVPGCLETRQFAESDPGMDVSGCDAMIHLAGENVFGLWTAGKRRRIRQSREFGTRALVEAIRRAEPHPSVLVSSSGIAYYGNTGEHPVEEQSEPGSGFLAEVAKVWEAEADRAGVFGVRVAKIRTAMVLGPGGGALQMMAPVFRLGLGGELGDGQQWMSWIHLDDVASLFLHAAENDHVTGALNASSPEPCRNSDFTDTLADVVRRPAIFRAPGWMLKAVLGEFSGELLEGRRVIPTRTLAAGFEFGAPKLRQALQMALAPVKD